MPNKVRDIALWAKKHKAYLFPLFLLMVFTVLVSLRISGTSAGVYYPALFGSQAKDPSLIYGQPKPIRSDEWLAGTQKVISQSKLGFPKNNPDLGDMAISVDTPNKDWSTLFRPQNWSFFIIPLEYAFAFKWWFLMLSVMISAYFFTLRVLPRQYLFSALLSTAFGLSPFLLWWYQSAGFLTIAYGLIILMLFIRIMNGEKIKWVNSQKLSYAIHALLIFFFMSCFGLVLYPPFQIPVAIGAIFFSVGYLVKLFYRNKLPIRSLLRRLAVVVASILLTFIVGIAFIISNHQAIHGLDNTIYPGHRTISSGGMNILQVLDSFVMPVEQSTFRSAHFFTNQSEASNFILLTPFLFVPSLVIIWHQWRVNKRIDFILLALTLCSLLFLLRAFVPAGSAFYKLFLLQKVPNNGRLVIGMGFIGILQLVYLVKRISQLRVSPNKIYLLVAIYSLCCFVIFLWTGNYIRHNYPLFLSSIKWIVLFAGTMSVIIAAFLTNKKVLGASLFLLFTVMSCYKILPLYRGLGIETHGKIIQKMADISPLGSRWVTVGGDASSYENFGWLAGRESLSGSHNVPDLKLWEQVAGPQYEYIYNRTAHVFFSDSPSMTVPIKLTQPDAFKVKFSCDSFIERHAQFALSVHPLAESCVNLETKVVYPTTTFYLYKIA